MPGVAKGAYELRVKDRNRAVRVFYFIKHGDSILVFHAFEKTSQKTPLHEIELGKKRLKELLHG